MDESIRTQKLNEIKQNEDAFMTGIRIPFEGETKQFNAYKIPLEYLIYNKYNGRIGSYVKSYEKQSHSLNPEVNEDIKIIEDFLWKSNEERNKFTEASLVKEGQKQYGIVTFDGKIIDGNRRAFLLNKIYREREKWHGNDVDHCRFFIAVILKSNADPREVSKLETIYQMGEDSKLDYNPIEKYLKCKDLKKEYKFTELDIAKMMGEKKTKIIEWLEIMDIMDDYLMYLEYDGIYTRLDNREGQFVDLNRYLKRWKNGGHTADWAYTEADITDLKSICFDYIRAEYEGKEFRNIAQTSKNGSVFSKERVWHDFLQRHQERVESLKEKSVEQIKEENPDGETYKLLEARDREWREKAEKHLVENLRRASKQVDNIVNADKPQELLFQAFNALSSINTDAKSFYDIANKQLLNDIQKKAFDYLKLLKDHNVY